MAKLSLEIVDAWVRPVGVGPRLAGTDAVLPYFISVTNEGGAPETGLGPYFTVETLASGGLFGQQHVGFNGGQAWERAPGYYIVGLLPATRGVPSPHPHWRQGTYVLGIGVRRRRRWIATDSGQTLLNFLML
jgi:hypothetical protein